MNPSAKTNHTGKGKKVLLVFFALLLCYVAYTSYGIYSYAQKDETRPADAAIVLGAGIRNDQPSPVFEERIKHGIWLYKNGYVSKLIFTGGKAKDKLYSEAFVAKKYALERGVAESDIYIEEKSTITQGNLDYATEILKAEKLSTVLIVSDPLHMKRAMLIAQGCGLNAHSSPTRTSKYTSVESKAEFLARETIFYIGHQFYHLLH